MATDSLFTKIVLQSQTGRLNFLKKTEDDLYDLIKTDGNNASTFYHRVVATDGLNVTASKPLALQLIKSNEPLSDFIELDPENYRSQGKIESADGQGSGALWDQENKLWLADYGGTLYIKQKDGRDASFSPLKSVTVNGKSYSLKPVNGIELDID